jgi:hypothetical protein
MIKRREIILAMSDFLAALSAVEGQSLAIRIGFPIELLPMLRKFNRTEIQLDEILKAWSQLTDNPSNQ